MTAPILTEQRTKLELVEDIPERLGQCFKRNGAFVIEIKKGHLYAGFMNVFLHECAHIKLQAEQFVDMAFYSSGVSASGVPSQKVDGQSEACAEGLASKWLKFADNNLWRFEGTKNERRLKALINKDAITAKS